jgi:hypothetical protein
MSSLPRSRVGVIVDVDNDVSFGDEKSFVTTTFTSRGDKMFSFVGVSVDSDMVVLVFL